MIQNNLEYYKVFYYTAKLGSLTRAAETLHISQPAVSQALKQLEAGLGVELFYRASRGVRLTGAGEMLYEDVRKGYESIEEGEQKLFRINSLEMGEVRIGASDMTLRFYLLPYLERFHEGFPHVKVMVTNAPTPETLSLLKEGVIDFGVVSSPFREDESLRFRPVRDIEDIFVGGKRFTEYMGRTLEYEKLADLPMICLEKNTSTRSYMDRYLETKGLELQPEFELATSDMIVQFALRNLGIGCVVRDFAEEKLKSEDLFELRFHDTIPKRNICVVQTKKKPLSRAAAKLLEIMEEEQK